MVEGVVRAEGVRYVLSRLGLRMKVRTCVCRILCVYAAGIRERWTEKPALSDSCRPRCMPTFALLVSVMRV